MNTYYKILNEIAAVFDMDQWDDQVNTFTDAINDHLKPFVHNTKWNYIYILEYDDNNDVFPHNFPQIDFYRKRCYVNGEKVVLESNGTIENKWKDKETVNVTIEDLDQLGESCEYMFFGCKSLISVPKFNTNNVINMKHMFHECESLVSVPLFDTSSVTNMASMFYMCHSLVSVPLFDTRRVTDMNRMFYMCDSLESIPLFDTSSVTDMFGTFYGCRSLSEKTKKAWRLVWCSRMGWEVERRSQR